jgi:hypothetical protein
VIPEDSVTLDPRHVSPAATQEYRHQLLARSSQFAGRAQQNWDAVSRAKDRVLHAAGRLAHSYRVRERAEQMREATENLLAAQVPTGHPFDAEYRQLPTSLYAVILAVLAVIAWLIDKGTLLVLDLDRAMTETFAMAMVVATLGAAHVVGSTKRRGHQVVESRAVLGIHELHWQRIAWWAGHVVVVSAAVIRAIAGQGSSRHLVGLLFLAIGVLDFNSATWAAYHHTHPGVRVKKEAAKAARDAVKRCEADLGNLREQVRRWRAAWRRAEAEAQTVAARADELLARDLAQWQLAHPGQKAPILPEPGWLEKIRRIGAGGLPPELDVAEAIARQGLDPEEAL